MVARVRSLGWLVASAWLTGCGPADEVDVTNTLEGVLPATESSKDFGDYVVYFNALNTDQLKPEIAREYEIEFGSIDVNLVLAMMDTAKNPLNIVILDACRNNPFARNFRSLQTGLAQIDAPTLVIGGAQDPSTPPAEHAARIAAAIPGARLEVLDPGAHLINVERPDEVTALIAGHLEG